MSSRLALTCLYAAMEAEGLLSGFLDAVTSRTTQSGCDAVGGAGFLSPAQLAEAIAPIMFRASPQVRSARTELALTYAFAQWCVSAFSPAVLL